MRFINSMEALKLCSMSKNGRHAWIYENVFLSYADDCIKYNHVENGDVTREYIASGLYTKFLELREKSAEQNSTVLDCTYTDIVACKWVMCLIRKITNNMNFGTCGEYTNISGYDLQGFTSAIRNNGSTTKEITFNDIHSDGYTKLERSKMSASKKVDVIDVLKQWENRASRNAIRNESQFKMVTDSEGNSTSQQDFIRSNYGNPLTDLLNKCSLERARILIHRIYNEVQNGNRIIDIVSSDRTKTPAERRAICDFRKRHNNLYEELDYLTDKLEIIAQ